MQLIEPPGGRPWALIGLCSASLLANIVLGADALWGGSLEASSSSAAQGTAAEGPAASPVEGAVAEGVSSATVESVSGATPGTVDAVAQTADVALPADVKVLRAPLQNSLSHTFQVTDPEHGDVISAVYSRLFVWDLDLRSDLQKGDSVELAYTWDGQLAHIPVARFTSKKLGRTLSAYKYKMSTDTFPSWWDENGQEMAFRLVDGPLANYEQITSLLKDRPKHRGMDFKVPEGTAVVSPKAGTVAKVNWNVSNNGNCVEVSYSDGVVAKFLHLSRTDVRAGERVTAGQAVGLSGNTGHSTAPHLHYELERGGRTLDPIDYHGTVRRSLPDAEKPGFGMERQRYDGWLAHAEG